MYVYVELILLCCVLWQLPEGGENELVQVFRLGGSAEGVLAERLVEMKACQVVSSEKHCLALCDGGTVCEVEGGTSPTNMKVWQDLVVLVG